MIKCVPSAKQILPIIEILNISNKEKKITIHFTNTRIEISINTYNFVIYFFLIGPEVFNLFLLFYS